MRNGSIWGNHMFANISIGVKNFAFPDVCNEPTPAGPVPFPLVNIAQSVSHVPSVFNVILGGGLAENLLTQGTISSGDEAGVAMGVVSGSIVAPDRPYTSSVKIFYGGIPSTRLTTVTGQNGVVPNSAGISISPGQVQVVLLS